jgi:hypothetical protein
VVGMLLEKKLRYLMRQEVAERQKDTQMENNLYECIYDIILSNTPQANYLLLKAIKADTGCCRD